jgi:hypothetical protein
MRTVIIVLTVAAAARGAQSQTPSTPPAVPRAIREIRAADLKRDLFAMASPAMRGREGGTLDELKASMWIAEQYRRMGLEPAGEDGSWFQWFNIVRTRVSQTASSARVAGQALTLFTDIIPLTVAPVNASGPVLWLSDPADSTIDVRGRIVATRLRAPSGDAINPFSYPFNNRYATAAINGTMARLSRRGAAAILLVADSMVDANFDALAVMRVRGQYSVDRATPTTRTGSDRVPPPPVAGDGPTPGFMLRASTASTLQGGGGAEAALDIRVERFEVPSVNVIGVVRGTDPVLRNEYVLFSSHQDANGVRLLEPRDSVLAGADDNASTTVAHFAAARAFIAQRPKRSILVVNHGAEERGLLGSRYHSAHPVVPFDKIVAVLNADMIGRNHPDTAGLLGSQPPHRNSRELVAMALAANAATARFAIDSTWDRPTHREGFYFRSDHAPYARLRIPAVYYTAMLHDDYHTARDVPERIDYGKLTRMAQWMYMTGWLVANAARRPAVDADFQLER